jgi:hypothetical protein
MFWIYEMIGRCVFQFCMFIFYLYWILCFHSIRLF